MPRGRPAKGANKGQAVKAADFETGAEPDKDARKSEKKVISKNKADDDALEVIMQEAKDRAKKRKSEEVSDTKASERNIASEEQKTEQKEEEEEDMTQEQKTEQKEEKEYLAERSKQEEQEEIGASDTKESKQNIASEQKMEEKEEEQNFVERSKQEEPEEIEVSDTKESQQNIASQQKMEEKEEEQNLVERSKEEEPEEIEVSDTKASEQNIAIEQKMEQKNEEEKEQDIVEQSKQEEPEENKAAEHKAEDEKEDVNGELKQEPKEVLINRAPVLTLWVAVVAEREGYTFEEGLSFGKFIAGVFAHTKGKRIGIYDDEIESEVQKAAEKGGSKNQKKRKLEQVERFEVFGMKLPGKRLENGLRPAVQNGKPIYPNVVKAYLHRASGSDFDHVKDAMEELARAIPSEKIGNEAYHLYEKFRPQVQDGPKGWGSKGVLDLNLIRQLAQEYVNS